MRVRGEKALASGFVQVERLFAEFEYAILADARGNWRRIVLHFRVGRRRGAERLPRRRMEQVPGTVEDRTKACIRRWSVQLAAVLAAALSGLVGTAVLSFVILYATLCARID
jgi:hypothetical protein